MTKSISVQITHTDSAVVVYPIGRIDSENYLEFQRQIKPLHQEKTQKLILDMSRCDYVSSAGFRVFFDLRKDLNARQGELAFCNIQPQVLKVFHIVRALPNDCLVTSTEDALIYLDQYIDQNRG